MGICRLEQNNGNADGNRGWEPKPSALQSCLELVLGKIPG